MTSSASGHCGPITAECPASCPASVISLMALNRLLDSDDAPQTVGGVVGLYQVGKLTGDTFRYLRPRRRSGIEGGGGGGLYQGGKLTGDTFRYLRPRRRSEIEAGLVLAGFRRWLIICHSCCDCVGARPDHSSIRSASPCMRGTLPSCGSWPAD